MSRWILCLLLLSGCSSHAVRCNARLQPINPAVASASKQEVAR